MLNRLFRFDFGRLDDGNPTRIRDYALEYTVEDITGVLRSVWVEGGVWQEYRKWGGEYEWRIGCVPITASENLWAQERLKEAINEPVVAHDMVWPASAIRRIRFEWLDPLPGKAAKRLPAE